MKTVSVCTAITYLYEVEIPDDVSFNDKYDLLNYVDTEDPVYKEICGVLGEAHLNYEGRTVSIVDAENDEALFSEDED